MGSKHSPPRWWNLGGVEEALEEAREAEEARWRQHQHQLRALIPFLMPAPGPLIAATDKQIRDLETSIQNELDQRFMGHVERGIASQASSAPIPWQTYEVVGSELLHPETRLPISSDEALTIGQQVMAWFPYLGYCLATVTGPMKAETESTLWCLERDRDDRHAWTSVSVMNKAAIHKLTFTSTGEG